MSNLSSVLLEPGQLGLETRDAPSVGDGQVLVRVDAVGVCGSDTHYYRHGSIGEFVLDAPLVLGHEPAGTVVAVGARVDLERLGQRVSLEPGVPCGRCSQCRSGTYNLCPDIRFMATPPHDGVFARLVCWDADFAHPVPDGMDAEAAALVEPLSVGVWAARRSGIGPGDRVLITGAGPVGLLAASVAQAFGAADVVVRDINEVRLAVAATRGVRTERVDPSRAKSPAGEFDVLLECSGAPGALGDGLLELAPRGRAVMIGLPAEEPTLPLVRLHHRELTVTTNFRYANTWPLAISLIASGAVPTEGIVTHRYGLAEIEDALLAGSREPTCIKAMVLPQMDTVSGGR